MNWYLKVLRQYVDFKGRARRKEYWTFVLFNILFGIGCAILDGGLGLSFDENLYYGPIYGLYSLVMFLPSLAVGVRRLHDIGKSGWMLLIVLIPIIGVIWLLVLLVTDSQPGENAYGPNPKEEIVATDLV